MPKNLKMLALGLKKPLQLEKIKIIKREWENDYG